MRAVARRSTDTTEGFPALRVRIIGLLTALLRQRSSIRNIDGRRTGWERRRRRGNEYGGVLMRDPISSCTEGLGSVIDEDGRNRVLPKDPPSTRCLRCQAWLRVNNRQPPFLCDLCKNRSQAKAEDDYERKLDEWRRKALKTSSPPPVPKASLIVPPVRRPSVHGHTSAKK